MTTEQLLELDKKYLWHPCSQMHDYEAYPAIPIAKAEGVWLYRPDGSRILDAISSWWVNIFGHGNLKIKNRIKEQLDKLEHVLFANYTHSPAAELAGHLVKMTGNRLEKVFFTDNGSSSVEAALKMSYHYWYNRGQPRKKQFIYLKGAYHGETLGALAVCALDQYKAIYAPLLMPTAMEVSGPDCYRCPFGQERQTCAAECFAAMEQLLREQHRNTAAVIVEPVIQCSNGMNIYAPGYLQRLSRLCRELDVHLICDEIASGFGRTGKMLACEHAAVIPDFITLSKAITGGFLPLAAVLTTTDVYHAFYAPYTDLRAFMHSHTYSGNPLACAAACAVFELFSEGSVLDLINETGRLIRQQLQPLEQHPHVGQLRSLGIITAVELVKDKVTKTAFDWQQRIGYRIYRNAEQQGVLLRNLGDVIYFIPPYTINREEIDFMTGAAIRAIREVL